MIGEILLRAVLGALAAYHVAIGILSVSSLGVTSRVMRALYGVEVEDGAQLRYALRMLGLYAITLGVLLCIATWNPAEHKAIVVVVAGLQLARACSRVLLRRELASAFHVSSRRNAFNAALLVAEAAVLIVCLPLARER